MDRSLVVVLGVHVCANVCAHLVSGVCVCVCACGGCACVRAGLRACVCV